MEFLSQVFTVSDYYNMVKTVFDNLGYDYYKGLKNKLPPIRYIEISDGIEYVTLAHPNDFIKNIKLFTNIYLDIKKYPEKYNLNIKLDDIKSEILEIYPSTQELVDIPNGFIGLFVNDIGKNMLIKEFNENDEVARLDFIKVDDGINISDIKCCGVIEIFIKKFNINKLILNKYNNLYLVIGEMKNFNINSGISLPTNKFNIIGGKRSYDETSIDSTIRESIEEFGLNKDKSKIYKLINILVPKTKDIIKGQSFNVYCIYITPKSKKSLDNNIDQLSDKLTNILTL